MAKILRAIAAALILAAGLLIVVFATQQSVLAERDSITYWAAGKLLIHGSNPYSAANVLSIEKNAGFLGRRAFLMRNPPHALFLAVPMGALSLRGSGILWSVLLVAALMWSVRMLWRLHGSSGNRTHLFAYFFPPALACIVFGQIGIFMLLGFVLFLRFHASRPWLAGMSLLLCSIKPHLFAAFAVVLLLWCVSKRAYSLLCAAAVSIGAAALLPLAFDPHVWSHYAAAMRAEDIQNEFVPTLSLMFRLAVHRGWLWLQFLPLLASLLWAVWYYRSRRWNWLRHGALLAAVGVAVAPYAWTTDEVLALPAVLGALFALEEAGRSLVPYLAVMAVGTVEVLFTVPVTTGAYLWMAPVWVFIAWRGLRVSEACEASCGLAAAAGARNLRASHPEETGEEATPAPGAPSALS